MTAFLSLDDNDPIVETISRLGEGLSPCQPMMWAKPRLPCQPVLNHWRHSYARCMLRKAQPGSYPNCAGYFSEQKMFQSEMLPPTVGTLIPHVQRVKCMVMRDRGYTSPHPSLPNLEGNGWSEKGLPIKWLIPPAPRAVVELVKRVCKGECKGNCYSGKNGLACTPLSTCMQPVAATIRTITGMIKTTTQ